MYIYVYIYIYSSYRKLAWVGFEPTTTEFHSDIWNSVQLALGANFVQLLQCHLFFQCLCFISVFAFISHYICFKHSLTQVIMLVAEWIDTLVFTTEGLLEIAIESWPEWDLNPTTTEFCSDALTDWAIKPWVQLALRANFVQLLQFPNFMSLFSVHVSFRSLPSSATTFALSKVSHR